MAGLAEDDPCSGLDPTWLFEDRLRVREVLRTSGNGKSLEKDNLE
jgi:hypothetical protein